LSVTERARSYGVQGNDVVGGNHLGVLSQALEATFDGLWRELAGTVDTLAEPGRRGPIDKGVGPTCFPSRNRQ
jgi:hypothetical protein